MSNTFGHIYRLTSFGESHGAGIGGVIDGCPAGVTVDMAFIQGELDRRRPGQSALSTPRKEADEVEILSGVFEGKTTGTPIGFLVRNTNTRSQDYDNIKDVFRPSHADYTYFTKYGIRDYRGGGRASARETIARVVAGAFAKLVLKQMNISIEAFTTQIGPVTIDPQKTDILSGSNKTAEGNIFHCPDREKATEMQQYIAQLKAGKDSTGGIVRCVIKGVPAGWGEPIADKLHAALGAAMLSIPACKAFAYGSGFDVCGKGSERNDAFYTKDGQIKTRSNYSGGIQGGISNGETIYFDVAFKPIASISQAQESIDKTGQSVSLEIQGRHDPCVLPRALPVVEAMAAITLLDACLKAKTQIKF